MDRIHYNAVKLHVCLLQLDRQLGSLVDAGQPVKGITRQPDAERNI